MKKLLSILLVLSMIISCVSMMAFVANAEEEATPVGFKIVGPRDWYIVLGGDTVFDDVEFAESETEKTIELTLYSESQESLWVEIIPITTNWGTLSGYNGSGATLDPGVPKTISVTIPKTSGGVEYTDFTFRINARATEGGATHNFTETDCVYIIPSEQSIVANAQVNGTNVTKITEVPDALIPPVGVKFEVTEALDDSGEGFLYYFTGSKLTKDMAVDGKISKAFDIYNPSDVAVNVWVYYMDAAWQNMEDLFEKVEIPAGQMVTVKFEIPCDENGTYDGENGVDTLLLRFDMYFHKVGEAIVVEAENNPEVANIKSGQKHQTTTGKSSVTGVKELPEIVPIYVGKKITLKEAIAREDTITNAKLSGLEDGTYEISYVVYNPNDFELKTRVYFQTAAWQNINSGDADASTKIIPANSAAILTTQITVAEGKVTGDTNSDEQANVLIRFDFMSADGSAMPAGSSFIVKYNKDNDPMVSGLGGFMGKSTKEELTELPDIQLPSDDEGEDEGEGETAPVGVKLEVTLNQAKGVQGFYRLDESAGVTKDMAVNGKITKTFVLYNVSENALVVESQYQNQWDTIESLTQVNEIPAGGKVTVKFEIPCDENGTIDGTIPVTNLCLRFNIDAVEGSRLKKGDAIVIATENNPEILALKARTYDGENVAGKGVAVSTVDELPKVEDTSTESKPTGDAIPVAMIAMAVVAFAGLAVVVAKKRRED